MQFYSVLRRAVSMAGVMAGLSLTTGAMAQTDPVFSTGSKFQQTSGEALYRSACLGCHMAQGQGATGGGAFPALAANARLASAEYPIYVVLHGQKGMPPFGNALSDDQVAALVTYLRSNFGNKFEGVVTAESVKKLRP